MKENLSIFHWLEVIRGNHSSIQKICECLSEKEIPNFITAIFERKCDQKCRHCIYSPCRESSMSISRQYNFNNSLLNLCKQLKTTSGGLPPNLTHAGRMLLPWHITILKKIRKECKDLELELLDNGSYLRHIGLIKQHKLKFDGLSISIDGPEGIHNLQRDSKKSFAMAIDGIRNSPEILSENGSLSIEFTATKLNYDKISQTIDFLFEHSDLPITTICVAPLSPWRNEIAHLETNSREFAVLMHQLSNSFAKYNKQEQKIMFQIFHLNDLKKLAAVIGSKRFCEIFSRENRDCQDRIIGLYPGRIKVFLENLFSFSYYPMSLAPTEGILFDADASARFALSQSYEIEKLRSNHALQHLTIKQTRKNTDLKKLHQEAVRQWFVKKGSSILLGEKHLNAELDFFRKIRGDG